MKDINQFLTDLVKGSTHIIASPKTIRNLISQGIKFNEPSASKSTEELIGELFDRRKEQALKLKLFNDFPTVPNIATPTITSLYDEIRECILLGLNGAAISLSAVLIEFSLKHAIVKFNNGKEYDKNEWDRIENIELGEAIIEAKRLEILNETWVKLLNDFKDNLRNPYLHYNIKKITKNVIARKTKRLDVTSKKVTEEDIAAEDNPVVWTLAKKFVDREHVLKAFGFADTLIKYLHMKLMSFEEIVDHIEGNLQIKYLEKNNDQASNPLHLFINEETKEKFILKGIKEGDLELVVYFEYLPLIKTEFKTLVFPEGIAAFNTKDYVYFLIPYYEGEHFDFNTTDIKLAHNLVDLVKDLSIIDTSMVLKGKNEFDYIGFEKNFWKYVDKAISLGLIPITDAKQVKADCAKVLSLGKANQKMIISNGDFNPRNVIRLSNGQLVLIDWNGIISPLEHLLAYPWLLNWQNPTWQNEYALKFESNIPIDINRLRMHLMNIALIRAVDEKAHKNVYADNMSRNHMKNFFASIKGFKSLLEISG